METLRDYYLTYDECPKTRAEFVRKYRDNEGFRFRADLTGFRVIGESVMLPNGKIANPDVR